MVPLDYIPFKDEWTLDLQTTTQKSYENKPAKNLIEEVV